MIQEIRRQFERLFPFSINRQKRIGDNVKISIIIPVLNEAENISRLIEMLCGLRGEKEILFVDGGSDDGTATRIPAAYRVLKSQRGRGIQMNAGAQCASGEILLFLHGDTHLDRDALEQIIEKGISRDYAAGCFSLTFDREGFLLKMIAFLSNMRVKTTKIMFGDQGIFVKREIFEELGGFLDIPLMEDLEFSRRLKRRGRIIQLKTPITTSARRFERMGTLKTILLMHKLKILYFLGETPEKLQALYRNVR